ncbi:MAG TPA: erythromycin esterase family protein [Caldimonas sp.]|jgi:erythromycin esterase-like protein|nr:erythromycin esterase family protein [Caldimonas sp.]HEX2541362.1 erythromycin esterase family protein [Caldimonas sp.]
MPLLSRPSLAAAAMAVLPWLSGCSPTGGEGLPRGGATAAARTPAAPAPLLAAARPLTGSDRDHDTLVAAGAGATRMLLGESTHGTHEFYRERARITERLVREAGFLAVLIEGDWSSTWNVNRYVRGDGPHRSAEEALAGYTEFPQWMWGNTDFRDFVERLRTLNLARAPRDRVGVYGMDVYDLFDAADAVLGYLGTADREAAARAQRHYECFAAHRPSPHSYGQATLNPSRSCEAAAAAVREEVGRLPPPTGIAEAELHFAAVRAAASVAVAEAYFRAVYAGGPAWNLRDRQMAVNVDETAAHVASASGRPGKVVVWSHNTHSGDARATQAAERGELNLGQLMRERHGAAAFLVGFFTYAGQVMAAPEWDSPGRVYDMRPARPESHAAFFRSSGMPALSVTLRGDVELAETLREPRPQRAVGVVYAPHAERTAHYFEARLAAQFDAAVYLETTGPLRPLPR